MVPRFFFVPFCGSSDVVKVGIISEKRAVKLLSNYDIGVFLVVFQVIFRLELYISFFPKVHQ